MYDIEGWQPRTTLEKAKATVAENGVLDRLTTVVAGGEKRRMMNHEIRPE